MAKQKSGKSSKAQFDEKTIVYFLLVNLTSRGRIQKEDAIRKDQQLVTNLVKDLGGTCELFSTPGPYDFISRVDGVSAAGAIQIVQQLEAAGFAKAHLTPAFRCFK